MARFTNYDLKRSVTTIDKYGDMKKEDFQLVKRVPLAIFINNDIELLNNPNFSTITHKALYKGNFQDFQKHDRIEDKYRVLYIVRGKRKILLYLEEL